LSTFDKEQERERYEQRAHLCLNNLAASNLSVGASALPAPLRPPYIKYEQLLSNLLTSSSVALELCSGTGEYTEPFITSGCSITAVDISSRSLDVLKSRYPRALNLKTITCDIEALPLPDNSIDIIACAGGLSYGDNHLVQKEIYRLLKPGGYFICVDSLNHNPIYGANRFLHYLRGRRTLSTLKRMPTLSLISKYESLFGSISCTYFGSFSWLMPSITLLTSEAHAAKVSDYLDRKLPFPCLAFKFVLVTRKVKAYE
jgi:ubiquinone/menaquinone biosynthesis C-methylase UbiE